MQPLRGNLGPLTLPTYIQDTSWWQAVTGKTPVCAYAAKGAVSLAASYINLANPGTYNAAPGTAPTWDATNGWIGNGATNSRYLTTGIVPVNGCSILVRFSGATDNNNLYGSLTAGNDGKDFYIANAVSGVQFANGGRYSSGQITTSGVLGVAGTKTYRNGVELAGAMTAANITTVPIVLLARNIAGTTINAFVSAKVQAWIYFTQTLSAAEMATMTTAMNAL